MQIPDWVPILFFFGVMVFLGGFTVLISAAAMTTIAKRKLTRKILKALTSDDLSLDDFKNVQSTIGLTDDQTFSALSVLKSDVDCNEHSNRREVKPRLDKLIGNFKVQKPFSSLPENIRESIILAKESTEKPEVIDALAEKIQLSIKKQDKSDFMLKLATYFGLIIGLVGTLWGFAK